MNVTILGATGAIGREITAQLIQSRALSRQEILQLATNPTNPHSRLCAEGIRRDLQDAYAEINPELQVVEHPEEFIGDIVVVAGGRTIATDDFTSTRLDLVPFAQELCERYAGPLVASLTERELAPIFVVVTNPVEYVVQYFASKYAEKRALGDRFVIGMGAHSDSLRFQWEIAHDLGVSRDRVAAEVVGEHGPLMIPRWSTVQIRGMPEKEQERCLAKLHERDLPARRRDFDPLFTERYEEMMGALERSRAQGGQPGEQIDLLQRIESYRPDFRVILKPLLVHRSGSGTGHATGVAAVHLIQAILKGEAMTPNVQRMVWAPGGNEQIAFGVPTPLLEAFRPTGAIPLADWTWRERTFPSGSFRADRAKEEEVRIVRGLDALRMLGAQWKKTIS